MPKKREKSKIKKHELYVIVGALALIGIMLLFIFLKPVVQRFFSKSFIRFDFSEEAISPIGPIGPISQALQGSFTELFSGVGWRNPINSTVHQDFKTLTISFSPAYEIEEISPIGPTPQPGSGQVSPIGDTVTIGSRTFTGVVKKSGEQYEGYLYEVVGGELQYLDIRCPTNDIGCPLFFSQYPGKIVLGSDGVSKIFLLYAAYEGKAFEINLTTSNVVNIGTSDVLNIDDYSAIFNARVTEEGKIDPQVFYKDKTWWISSRPASAEVFDPEASDRRATAGTAKLLRLRDGMANDLTESVRSGIARIATQINAEDFTFTAAPAPESNAIYLIFGTSDVPNIDGNVRTSDVQTFRLRDLGFERGGELIWESLRLNAWEGEIVRGRFTRIDDSNIRTSDVVSKTSDVPAIKYFLSNDGGRHWVEAELNKFIDFETKGGDFRWSAELYPSSDQYRSPWIKVIGVEYYIVRK